MLACCFVVLVLFAQLAHAQDSPNTCPTPNYLGPSGFIQSPGFSIGQQYGNNLDCTYHIYLASGVVMLATNSFDTEACCDKLYIYNGPTTASPLLTTWSGVLPFGTVVQSTGNTLTARFLTDSSTTRPGFRIHFAESGDNCPANNQFTGNSGIVQSPNYPNAYLNDMDCSYFITVAATSIVQLIFDDFETESYADIVVVYDGPTIRSTAMAQLSGSAVANLAVFTTTQRYMTINFISDADNVRKGFSASYSAIATASGTQCRAMVVINDSTGVGCRGHGKKTKEVLPKLH